MPRAKERGEGKPLQTQDEILLAESCRSVPTCGGWFGKTRAWSLDMGLRCEPNKMAEEDGVLRLLGKRGLS